MGRPNQGGHIRRLGGSAKYRLIRVMVDGKSKQMLEHRRVMELHIGRKLLTTEHVHHIDHDGLNNDISNLQIVSGHDHQRMHLMGTRKWPVEEGEKLRSEGWTLERIADHYGVSPHSVLKAFRVRGISTKNERKNQQATWDIDHAKKLREEGLNWSQIGKKLGIAGSAISAYFKRRGWM